MLHPAALEGKYMSHFLPTRTYSDPRALSDNHTSVPSRTLLVLAMALPSPLLLLPSFVLYTLCLGPSLSASIHMRTIGDSSANEVDQKTVVLT